MDKYGLFNIKNTTLLLCWGTFYYYNIIMIKKIDKNNDL